MTKYTNDYFFERRQPMRHQDRHTERCDTANNALYGKVRSYRDIPDNVDDKLQAIATAMRIPVGELVRAFLEYAIAANTSGELTLNPTPRTVRSQRTNTLYPAR